MQARKPDSLQNARLNMTTSVSVISFSRWQGTQIVLVHPVSYIQHQSRTSCRIGPPFLFRDSNYWLRQMSPCKCAEKRLNPAATKPAETSDCELAPVKLWVTPVIPTRWISALFLSTDFSFLQVVLVFILKLLLVIQSRIWCSPSQMNHLMKCTTREDFARSGTFEQRRGTGSRIKFRTVGVQGQGSWGKREITSRITIVRILPLWSHQCLIGLLTINVHTSVWNHWNTLKEPRQPQPWHWSTKVVAFSSNGPNRGKQLRRFLQNEKVSWRVKQIPGGRILHRFIIWGNYACSRFQNVTVTRVL